MIRKRHALLTNVLCTLLVFILFNRCSAKGSGLMGSLADAPVENPNNPFSADLKGQDFSSDGGDMNVGSGANGEVNAEDKQAIGNLLNEMDGVNPQDETQMDPALVKQAEELLKREAQGQDVSQMKMMLGAQMMQSCAQQVAELSPMPGEPLLGHWEGECNIQKNQKKTKKGGPLKMEITGGYSGLPNGAGAGSNSQTQNRAVTSQPTVNTQYSTSNGTSSQMPPAGQVAFAVSISYQLKKNSGSSNGSLRADASGQGQVSTSEWQGTLTDSPQSGTGTLKGQVLEKPNAKKKKDCNGKVDLIQSKNPIPEKYLEGMKKAGQCYRQALFFMSPMMDKLFKNMDPKMSQTLQTQMLGVK